MKYNLQDSLERIASASAAREVYNQYLFMLLRHIGVIELVQSAGLDKNKQQLKLLAELYAVASTASNSCVNDQYMYDILREISYFTAINQETVLYSVDEVHYCVEQAKTIITNSWEESKKITNVTGRF